jgi:DedD protein
MAAPPRGSRLRLALGVAGLLLLAVPGFALGLFAGVVWREPALVASHLLGSTREVAAEPAAPARSTAGAAARDVAAPPPAAPAAAPPARRAPEPAAGAPAAPARVEIQVGAFAESAPAEKLAGALRRKGFPAFVSPSTGEAGSRWRVRVGPLPSREEAERTAARLKAEERLPTWVVEEGRS